MPAPEPASDRIRFAGSATHVLEGRERVTGDGKTTSRGNVAEVITPVMRTSPVSAARSTSTAGTSRSPRRSADPAARSPRIHGLDTLRAAALGLGTVLHSLLPFSPDLPWLFTDVKSTVLADITTYWIHLFRMVVFMALAGFFGRMVLHRRGVRSYLRDRLLRIGLPAIAFWPVAVLPLGILAGMYAAARGLPAGPPPEQAAPASDSLLGIPTGHLWFLWVLLESVLIVLLIRAILVATLGRERISAAARRVGVILSSPGGVLIAALPYLACLLMQGEGYILGIAEPTTLRPSVSALTAYLGAFAVGWFLRADTDALDRVARQWPWHLGAAVVTAAAGLAIGIGQIPLVLHVAIVALAGWAWTYAAIGLCMRFLRRENRVLRYLADSSYWVYLLHLPVVVGIGMLLADLKWPIALKLLITWAVTAAVLLLTYDLLVRGTWLGRWLNGRRRPRGIFHRRPGGGRGRRTVTGQESSRADGRKSR